jgi:signal transduction histidine kinase
MAASLKDRRVMPVKIAIPYNLNPYTMYTLFGAVIANQEPISREIEFDFSRVDFVESVGIVILSNLIEWLRKRNVTISYVNCDPMRRAIGYLDDVGFFSTYWGKPLTQKAQLRDTTFPFRSLMCIDSHQWIDGNIFPWLANKLEVTENSLAEFKTVVREIFNNIADHSEENVGCMHVQWHPNIKRVKIAVSDFGIGIPTEIRKVAEVKNDAVALKMATTQGFSSKKGRNMGAGLSYLIDNVVGLNKGWVSIYSGAGQITFNHVTSVANLALKQGIYPGTLISMILRTDNIVGDAEEVEEVQW